MPGIEAQFRVDSKIWLAVLVYFALNVHQEDLLCLQNQIGLRRFFSFFASKEAHHVSALFGGQLCCSVVEYRVVVNTTPLLVQTSN